MNINDIFLREDAAFAEPLTQARRLDGGAPELYTVNGLSEGTYGVKVELSGSGRFDLFYAERRFIEKNAPIDGTLAVEFTACVCDQFIKGEGVKRGDSLVIGALGAKIESVSVKKTDSPVIYLGGDSTVTDQGAAYPYEPTSTYCGWGQMIGRFLPKSIAVSNHAQSGFSTDDFLGKPWEIVKSRIKSGDYLMLQFGHNDQKKENLAARGRFSDNLRYMAEFAREKGAMPILVTSLVRILFDGEKIRDTLGEYGAAMRDLAKEINAPCIDLLDITTREFTRLGEEKSRALFRHKDSEQDFSHPNDLGGELIGRIVAAEMEKILKNE